MVGAQVKSRARAGEGSRVDGRTTAVIGDDGDVTSGDDLLGDGVPVPVRPGRSITGMSAVLVPYAEDGQIDWDAVQAHVLRTRDAGLTPAVNMDTGYVQLLGEADKARVLDLTTELTGGDFVAGAYVADGVGDRMDLPAYLQAASAIAERGGTPVIFPSHGLSCLEEDGWVAAHEQLGAELDRFIGFELGTMFVPYGRIVSLDAYRGLLEVPQCIGAKHSSLRRDLEWQRLALRDEVRPEFLVLTGNDLAIDMVRWGSDYLLGLSTFAPEAFALRDRFWAEGDARFYELNDLLQHLGWFTFRDPVPGYRHDAAITYQLRGWAQTDGTPPGSPRRPDGDRDVLAGLVAQLEAWERGER
jgi:dihydrodipicolinate synthase/N-acetylneuraminate lyase